MLKKAENNPQQMEKNFFDYGNLFGKRLCEKLSQIKDAGLDVFPASLYYYISGNFDYPQRQDKEETVCLLSIRLLHKETMEKPVICVFLQNEKKENFSVSKIFLTQDYFPSFDARFYSGFLKGIS